MVETAVGDGGRGADPFVELLRWTAREAGGLEDVAAGSGVAVRTLQDWLAGRYPRRRASAGVDLVHQWALDHVRGYPPASAPPGGLIDLSGPLRIQLAGQPSGLDGSAPAGTGSSIPARVPSPSVEGASEATSGPRPWLRPGPRRRGLAALSGVVVAVAVGLVVLAVGPASSHGHLPTRPTSPGYLEQAAFGGAAVFGDPRGPSGQRPNMPPMTKVEVGCWFHAPSLPSVSPDGNWYLIISPPYAGRWSPANSYFNGDAPHSTTVHNTDFAVPQCR